MEGIDSPMDKTKDEFVFLCSDGKVGARWEWMSDSNFLSDILEELRIAEDADVDMPEVPIDSNSFYMNLVVEYCRRHYDNPPDEGLGLPSDELDECGCFVCPYDRALVGSLETATAKKLLLIADRLAIEGLINVLEGELGRRLDVELMALEEVTPVYVKKAVDEIVG